ncbi:CCA tRNA nucleotidyltransferase [Paracoccus sulfuroxidans]|uniref:Poly(A) polymerase n=1 Tax=Paracoccus sulfuroxidans TaxID=384678 RepID=A0A562NW37_9RHOB|nr:CCA tRNA nucleotidyltransferase [Paracoccus sulfuroxidans]TWI35916.1 poly(A) polymerase [Paracoccus sulfuroxidans]
MTQILADFLSDASAQRVLGLLTQAGHQALVVGGAVRNALLQMPATDVDIATAARPPQVIALAEAAGLKAVPTGIEHGTVTIIAEGRPFEITTFRRDVETDGRRAVVAFSDRIEDDALRRDFTMNALYATPGGEVIDLVGGLQDIAARRLRFVGTPAARIREDYLRILRFFRFHAWYGQPGLADPEALDACAALAGGLGQISKERIGHEMQKLLAAPDPTDALRLMQDSGVLAQILPGADASAIPALIRAEADAGTRPDGDGGWLRRLALLGAAHPLEDLRLGKSQDRYLQDLHKAADWSPDRAAYRLGASAARDAALLGLASGKTPSPDWPAAIARAAGSSFPLKSADLMPELEGAALGRALRAAEDHWIDSGFTAPKSELIRLARGLSEPNPGRSVQG